MSNETQRADLLTMKPGTHTSFGSLKQIDAGVVSRRCLFSRKGYSMSNHLPHARQTFKISLDIETTLHLPSQEPPYGKAEQYYSALIQTLLAHPETLSQLFRLAALATLPIAWELLTVEYSKGGISEQEVLTTMIEQLEPDAQAYFTEEIEDEQQVFLFDGYSATIKHVQMTASDVA